MVGVVFGKSALKLIGISRNTKADAFDRSINSETITPQKTSADAFVLTKRSDLPSRWGM